MELSPQQKIKDLEFLLRREKLESNSKVKEILYQILEVYDALERLTQIALKQDWADEPHKFTSERFPLVSKKLLQILQRAGALQINSLHQPVNYEYHEVIEERYNPDVPCGQIIEVQREGFLFAGKVLRMAQVIIATASQ